VSVPQQYESSCLGAAVLGLYALQEISSLNIVSEMTGQIHLHHPIPANVETYKKILPVYSRLLQTFQSEYETIAKLQAELTQQ
jgi:gluconokinase